MSLTEKLMTTIARVMPDRAPDPMVGSERAVGRPLARIDGPLKVTGAARFAAEVVLEDMAFAAPVYSRIARGRIERVDAAIARGMPSVIDVMTFENCPRMGPPPSMMTDPNGIAMSTRTVMQNDEVHYDGQPVAVVIAETQDAADDAAGQVAITYATQPSTLSFESRLGEAKAPKEIHGQPPEVKTGDAEAALAKAAFRIDALYRTPRQFNAAIELHSTTAKWLEDGSVMLHDTQQSLLPTRYTLAKALGLSEDKVRILAPFVGGAFGNKGLSDHHLLCVAAARLTGRPVRLMLSREGVCRTTSGRTSTLQRVALGANADGTLAALIHTGAIPVAEPTSFMEPFSFAARCMVAAQSISVGQKYVELDVAPPGAMRAPGEATGTFALECAIDELAHEMRLDPIELRLRIEPEKEPVTGRPFSGRNLIEATRRGAERFRWSERSATPRSKRDGSWLIGHGVASATYPYLRMPASARIRMTSDGRVLVQTAAQEMGMGTATVQVQHAADRLGLTVDLVSFEYGDTSLPKCPLAGGSNQTASIVAAVTAASQALITDLLAHVPHDSPLAGCRAKDVQARDRGLWRIADPTRGATYVRLLESSGRDHVECEADAPAPLEMAKYSMHSYGAQFCEVRVHDVTGEVRVSRWLGSFDTGRILNARTAASQFRGGIVMGIGLALLEEALLDERTGRLMNPSLSEYHVPCHLDVPEIDVIWNDIPDPHAPLGLRGIGEIGITGVAAAIANAVFNATGKRIRDLPITLDKLLG